MIARMISLQGPPEQLATGGERGFRELVLPALQQQAGFQGAYVLLDRTRGKLLGLTFWESEAHASAAGSVLDPIRDTHAAAMGAMASMADVYEVVAQV